jgi:peptidoglycan/LPS O-acetylase OafA/YrhL
VIALSVAPTTRCRHIDALRGLAVLCMVVDHVCATFGIGQVARLTVGRVALPAFLLCSGWLLVRRPPSVRRLLELCVAASAATLVAVGFGLPIGQPDVLWLILAALIVSPVIRRWPVPALCLGVVQMTAWAIRTPGGWTGYEPGTIVALLAAGILWGERTGRSDLERFPSPAVLELIGSYPLSIYVGHLLLLGLLAVTL